MKVNPNIKKWLERKNIDQQNSVTQCEENMLLTKLFPTEI